jgi:beta-lactamase regulating signal transducer with metallopeptidase domain
LSAYALAAWLVASLGIAGLFVAVARRFARLRASWPVRRLGDVDVRVAPEIGPVALGILRPEIVVPRWLLDRCAEEQELAVAHEREHLRARDPLLIATGWAVVIAAPWNVGVWYMMSRFRLAIEVDCDARILRRGASAHAYGTLLIEVAPSAAPLTLGALTLAGRSHLHERIVMLRPGFSRFRRVRAALAVPCATVGLLVACQATVPASRPVARPSTATFSRPDTTPTVPAPRASIRDTIDTRRKPTAPPPTIFIDGVRSSWEQMRALDRARIANVEVLKGAAAIRAYGEDARDGIILITTKDDSRQ